MKSLVRAFVNWLHARRRRIDLAVLWPECKRQAHSLTQAKTAFALHAFHDSAWLCLGHDEVVRQINALR